MKFAKSAAAAMTSIALMAAAPLTQLELGTAPTWEQAIGIGQAAIRDRLIDPDSAKIEWPYNFVGGSLKALFGKTRAGYWTCGFVNAKNRMGGYTGRTWFLILINSGQVVSLEIGEPDRIDAASATCPSALKSGQLKPAPGPVPSPASQSVMAAAPSPEMMEALGNSMAQAAAHKGGMGIALAPSPFGALITNVAPGSAADRAGLKAGEIIEGINGISFKTLDIQTMAKVLQSAPATSTLSIIGVGPVKIIKPGS